MTQLVDDGLREPPAASPVTAVRSWTRLRGTVSLEIQGFFTDMGIDPALLYAAEVDTLLEEAGA